MNFKVVILVSQNVLRTLLQFNNNDDDDGDIMIRSIICIEHKGKKEKEEKYIY